MPTSARLEVAISPKISEKTVHPAGAMCTGKRQTHIRNAPSSRTAVTGIGPYGICMSAYGFARNFRKINCISAGRTESSAPTGICNPG